MDEIEKPSPEADKQVSLEKKAEVISTISANEFCLNCGTKLKD